VLNVHVWHSYSLAWDTTVVKEMGGYGAKVAANSVLEHLRGQTLIVLLSKVSGPADVGFYNRALSLSSMPIRIVGSSPYQAVFRALAAEQDNLDKSRYIYYRTVTLVAIYTLPLYVFAWWLAEPAIHFIYGERWLPSAAPLAILATSGLFTCVGNPSGAVLEARNRVSTEIKLNIVAWLILVGGVLYGLRWGLIGAAWATVAMKVFFNVGLIVVAGRELNGSVADLARAIGPALLLNGLLLFAIGFADAFFLSSILHHYPGLYAISITTVGVAVYGVAFLFMPIGSIRSEAVKWRRKLLPKSH
jgi:O-antigen/teichoic acid export membrane protein